MVSGGPPRKVLWSHHSVRPAEVEDLFLETFTSVSPPHPRTPEIQALDSRRKTDIPDLFFKLIRRVVRSEVRSMQPVGSWLVCTFSAIRDARFFLHK